MADLLRHQPVRPHGWRKWICRIRGHQEEWFQLTWSQRTEGGPWETKVGDTVRGCTRCRMLEAVEIQIDRSGSETVYVDGARTVLLDD